MLTIETEVVRALASGEVIAALAVPLSAAPHNLSPTVERLEGMLSGEIRSVAGALESDVLLVPARASGRTALYLVPTSAASVTAVTSLDMTRQLADVSLENVADGELILEDAGDAIRRALEIGAALLASEQLGVSRWCLDSTVEYLKVRYQFGRPVGVFQAPKHRLADLFARVESGAAVARYAAALAGTDSDDEPVATSLAQAFCSDLAVSAAEEAVQLHGGIGMTWEHPIHLYLKRAKANQLAFGTPGAHRARLGELLGLSDAGG
jgi:alkylation response protein AidB-like acyl-CoA dehydrogenase